ncbi:hypothetical protein GGI23_005019 [Coemansia sp. RSA 2559]|nr:hypothetical protein GGI23_005019 [Coemansia sp. RSA 2559]KAJ2859377.1 hypothetical protein GGI22_003006 [Coemansia erecta]
MSGFILNELLDKLPKRNTSNTSRFGSTLALRVATADAKNRTVIYSYEVTEDEIFHGYLASGWLSTIIDHATEPLVCLTATPPVSYTTSLNVHTLEPVLPGTRIEIACKLVQADGRLVQTTVAFRDAVRKSLVYATGVQSLICKDSVGPKL